jgi:Domain of unknown function (DUF4304)
MISGVTFSEAMAATVRHVAPVTRGHGFRKRRHSFNRAALDGIVHHLSFQMGAFDPPGTVEIPGLRPNLYGKFTVNLGIYVTAMARMGTPKSDWINDYNCQLRKRLGELLPEQADVWWSLEHPAAAEDVQREVIAHAIPWLDRFGSYRQIIDIFEADGRGPLGMHPAAPLDVADLYMAIGEPAKARDLLSNYAGVEHSPGHSDVIVEYLRARRLTDLVPLVNHRAKPKPILE